MSLIPTTPSTPSRILVLGAGTGTLGIFLALHGAVVDVSDLPSCLDLLQRNVLANLPALPAHACVTAVALDWTQPLPEPLLHVTYDIIIGSDVIYSPRLHEPLYRTLQAVARDGRTRVVLGYEGYVEDFGESGFCGLLEGAFTHEKVPVPRGASLGCDVILLQRVEEHL